MMDTLVQCKTLWVGDLQSWMDEPFLNSVVTNLGYSSQILTIKLIKDKVTGQSAKYGFLQFSTHENAMIFFQTFNGKPIPNSSKNFKMNWASYSTGKNNNNRVSNQQISVYVGDLDSSITQHKLLSFFKNQYPTAIQSKIITDNITKKPKGYGFIIFSNQEEAQKAITEMNGQLLYGKPIKVFNAFLKNKQEPSHPQNTQESESLISQRLKLYEQFYSMINDPFLKAEYDKQLQKTFGIETQSKKQSLKQSLESAETLSYSQTKKSEIFLSYLPQMVTYQAKKNIQSRILS